MNNINLDTHFIFLGPAGPLLRRRPLGLPAPRQGVATVDVLHPVLDLRDEGPVAAAAAAGPVPPGVGEAAGVLSHDLFGDGDAAGPRRVHVLQAHFVHDDADHLPPALGGGAGVERHGRRDARRHPGPGNHKVVGPGAEMES